MSVSTTNPDYYNCDQQDRSDDSVVGSEGKLKSTLSKTTSNETYLTNVDIQENDDEFTDEQSNLDNNIPSRSTPYNSQQLEKGRHSSNILPTISSSESSSSSLLPSRSSSVRHSTESVIVEQPTSTILPRLKIPTPSKPAPKKSASFSCMKTVPLSNFYLNQHHNHLNPHPIPLHPPPHLVHHSPNRVPSRELKKGCSRITRSKSNLSLVKNANFRNEFQFPRINLFPQQFHHQHHHDGQVLLPAMVSGHHHPHVSRKNSSVQYPLCVSCLRTNHGSSSSSCTKIRKEFILEMQEERMRIQEMMNRRKMRKQQKSNEKLALIAILLINVAFFISFCFLGMMFLRSVRLPNSNSSGS